MKLPRSLFIIFFILLHSTAFAQQLNVPDIYYLNGSEKQLYLHLSSYIRNNPLNPESLFYLYEIHSMTDAIDPETITEITDWYMNTVNMQNHPDKNSIILQSNILKDKLNYLNNSNSDVFSRENYIIQWRFSDVYNKYGNSDLFNSFEPETDKAAYKHIFKSTHKNGTINLSSFCYPNSGIVYLETSVNAPSSYNLRINCNTEYLVYINGKQVLENSRTSIFSTKRIINIKSGGTHSISLKLRVTENASFSIMTTTENSIPVSLPYTSTQSVIFPETEEFYDYPLNYLIKKQDSYSKSLTGQLLSFHENNTSIKLLAEACKKNKTVYNELILASTMINQFDTGKWGHIEGQSRIKKLWESYPNTPLLELWKAYDQYQNRKFTDALNTIKKSGNTEYLAMSLLELKIYRQIQATDKFLTLSDKLLRKYPYSQTLNRIHLDYLYYERPDRFSDLAMSYLKKHRDPYIRQLLFQYYRFSNPYMALELLREDVNNNDYDSVVSYSSLLIKLAEYSDASEILLPFSTFNNSPTILYLLGLIPLKQNQTADFHFNKFEHDHSSHPYIRKYYSVNKAKTISDLMAFHNSSKSDDTLSNFFNSKGPSTVYPYKQQIIKIFEDGKASILSDEMVYIASNNEIGNYGEYKIPFKSGASIIKARVYYRDGSFTDSVQIHNENNAQYITISNLKKDSLLHVVYQNDISTENNSHCFFDYNSPALHGYNHGVDSIEILVIYPKTKNLNFYTNYSGKERSTSKKDFKLYSYSIDNIPPVSTEPYAGIYKNRPFRYFLSIGKAEEFFNSYKSKFPNNQSALLNSDFFNNNYSAKSKKEIIDEIYNDIISNYKITGSLSYYPQDPNDTMYHKKGSPEDLVFLCKYLLFTRGINSYPALIKNQTDFCETPFPDSFSNIALYIPDETKPVWLDFSDNYLKSGAMTSSTYLSDAYIIREHSVQQIATDTFIKPLVKNRWKIRIMDNKTSFSLNSEYYGEEETVRKYFKDKRYYEYYITNLYSNFNKELIISDYFVSDPLKTDNIFKTGCSGELIAYVSNLNSKIIIKPFLSPNHAIKFTSVNNRKSDLYIPYTINYQNIYSVTLPENFSQENVSFTVKHNFKNSYINYSCKKNTDSDIMTVKEEIYIPKQIILLEEYELFKKFAYNYNSAKNSSFTLTKDDE